MKMTNSQYDILKFIALIFVPAFSTFVGTVGISLGYGVQTGVAVTIINAFGLFLGKLIQVSTDKYNNDKETDDGR